MSAAIVVNVLFFAQLRDVLGTEQMRLSLSEPNSDGLWHALRQGELEPQAVAALSADSVRIAVNQVLIEGSFALQEGDEVAFLPPVTGG